MIGFRFKVAANVVMAAGAVLVMSRPSLALPITFSDRATFLGAVGTSITDGYGTADGYPSGFNILSNVAMSAVLGQTKYTTTGFSNLNIVAGGTYCAGCNGSFRLDFTLTTLGTASGVFGVGLNFANGGSPLYTAFVTFGDGSTSNFALPQSSSLFSFFGITSDLSISSIAFGLPNGSPTINGSFVMDNLTIAAAPVPEPSTLLLLGTSLFLAAVRFRLS